MSASRRAAASAATGFPSSWKRSRTEYAWGERYAPTLKPCAVRTEATKTVTGPLPAVPATCTARRASCGSPRDRSSFRIDRVCPGTHLGSGTWFDGRGSARRQRRGHRPGTRVADRCGKPAESGTPAIHRWALPQVCGPGRPQSALNRVQLERMPDVPRERDAGHTDPLSTGVTLIGRPPCCVR
jgi:hypothetical protein